MSRPKPPEPLLISSMRLTQSQRIKFRRLGGSAWLRRMIELCSDSPNENPKRSHPDKGRG